MDIFLGKKDFIKTVQFQKQSIWESNKYKLGVDVRNERNIRLLHH